MCIRDSFCFADENLEAYGVGAHRHTPEIEQILGIPGRLVFTPHLAPLNRGLLSTVTLPLSPDVPLPRVEELVERYAAFYADAPFVQVLSAGVLPRTASVAGTNHAHVGVGIVEAARAIVAVGAIDNLGKGAAGQAVQCANVVFEMCIRDSHPGRLRGSAARRDEEAGGGVPGGARGRPLTERASKQGDGPPDGGPSFLRVHRGPMPEEGCSMAKKSLILII